MAVRFRGAVNGPLVALGGVGLIFVRGEGAHAALARSQDRGGDLAGLAVGCHRPRNAGTGGPARQLLGSGCESLGRRRFEAQEGGKPARSPLVGLFEAQDGGKLRGAALSSCGFE